MKLFAFILLLAGCCFGQEDLLLRLFEERDPAQFEKLYAEAKKAKLSPQALIEARFLFLVDQNDDAKLAAFSKDLKAHLPQLNLSESEVFAVPEDYKSIVEYTQALAAIENDDPAAFKKHISEALWLSPRQAQLFGRVIETERQKNYFKTFKPDLSVELPSQLKKGEVIHLKDSLRDHQALFIHFWSPWARESIETLPDYLSTAQHFTKAQLACVSVLLGRGQESLDEGDKAISELGENLPGQWVIDPPKNSFALNFRIQAFPSTVLISKTGDVLFAGQPNDPKLWEEVQKIDPEIKRPDLEPKN